tara:strand:- start:1501 stop:2226 length:726 start_codon:yes stop_codon:yes gene_type:complete
VVFGTHGGHGFLANRDRFDEPNSHRDSSSQDFWRDLRMLKYDCRKGVVMSDSFERAWRIVKALPEQQAVSRRGAEKFMFADLAEGSGPYMGHGFESEGTIHPAILGMMARREKARHDESVERNRSEPNEQLRRILTKPKSVEQILEDGDMDMNIEANRESQNRRDFSSWNRGQRYNEMKPTPLEEQEPGKLMGRNEYPESFDTGWADKVHPGSGEFDRHEMSDGQSPHWMSHRTSEEKARQ